MIDPLGGPAYWLPFLIGFALAYLVGSIPFGLLLARAGGAGDLRRIGSGNIGATNVLRTGRKGLALATLALDMLKGALPAWLGQRYFGPDMAVVAGLAAVVGHCFPLWLKFRGGKGVATASGVVAALTPWVALILVAVFALIVLADPLRVARLDPRRDRRRSAGVLARPRPGGRALPRAGAADRAQARRQHPPAAHRTGGQTGREPSAGHCRIGEFPPGNLSPG